jgi:very-short-patch-repair endonuclease
MWSRLASWCAVSGAERIVMELAAGSHGVVTGGELARAGIGRRAVARRLGDGRLRRLHRGVFLVGPLLGARTLEVAAVLAVGRDAAISHRSAAELWELLPPSEHPIDVTVTEGHPHDRRGIRIHRSRSLLHSLHDGVRVTTPLRTLEDLTVTATRSDIERAVEEAQVRRLVTRGEVERLRGRAGAAARGHEPSLTRSEAERRLLRLVRAADLPAPHTNARIGPFEVDFLWPDERVIVEVDGFAFHSTRAAFERDRVRDRALQTAGYTVLRITWRQLVHESAAVIAALAAALARCQRRSASSVTTAS